MKIKFVIATLIVGGATVHAQQTINPPPMQETAPFQASLTPDIAVEPPTTVINGLSLNIWGENSQHAFTIGFVNGSTGESVGFNWGIFNYDDSYTGVQWGFINFSRMSFKGWQDAFVNFSQGDFTGWQDGWVNMAENFHGLQTGVVNYAGNLRGVQIGFVNVAMNNDWFDQFPNQLAKGFPIVNWSF